MRHVPIAELKDKASEIVAAAEAGEEITITRHGRAVVRMTGLESDRLARQRAALADMLAHRDELRAKGVRVTREDIVAWRDEGRDEGRAG